MVYHNHHTENYRNLSDLLQPKKYFVYRTITKRRTRQRYHLKTHKKIL